MDRRRFLQWTGAAGLTAAWGALGCAQRGVSLGSPRASSAGGGARFPLSSVGLQLYTVRALMQQDAERTLEQVAAAGYHLVETAGLYGHTPESFRASLDRYGIRTVSGHYALELLDRDVEAVFATAHALGQEYVVVPFLPGALHGSRDAYVALADRFNLLGARARAAGLRFAYHNHAFEFETFGSGAAAFDTLLDRTDPALVSFELDAYWVYKTGRDPLQYFAQHPGRFALCHVKDGTAPPARAMVDVGAGVIDFAGLFALAERAGLRYAMVEHDQPADAVASIRASHAALVHLLSPA